MPTIDPVDWPDFPSREEIVEYLVPQQPLGVGPQTWDPTWLQLNPNQTTEFQLAAPVPPMDVGDFDPVPPASWGGLTEYGVDVASPNVGAVSVGELKMLIAQHGVDIAVHHELGDWKIKGYNWRTGRDSFIVLPYERVVPALQQLLARLRERQQRERIVAELRHHVAAVDAISYWAARQQQRESERAGDYDTLGF